MVNFDVLLQGPVFDFFAVPVTFTPLKSQPGRPAYQRARHSRHLRRGRRRARRRHLRRPAHHPRYPRERVRGAAAAGRSLHHPARLQRRAEGRVSDHRRDQQRRRADHADDPQIRDVRTLMGVTDTQSYSLVIRDVFYDAVAGDAVLRELYQAQDPDAARCSPSCCPTSPFTSWTRTWRRTAMPTPARSASATRCRSGSR